MKILEIVEAWRKYGHTPRETLDIILRLEEMGCIERTSIESVELTELGRAILAAGQVN